MNSLLSLSLVTATTLLILWCVYMIFIRRQQNIRAGRVALTAIIVLSLASPALLFLGSGKDRPSAEVDSIRIESVSLILPAHPPVDESDESTPGWIAALADGLRKVYLAGLASAVVAILISGLRLLYIIMCARKTPQCRSKVYLSASVSSPFAWGGMIVMTDSDWNSPERNMIIAHERAHVHSLHWADLLAAHVLLAVNWYNPAAWALLRELHRLHEYEADAAVIASGTDIYDYQRFLLEKAAGHRLASLADSLHQSNLKKRITMMTKGQNQKSGARSLFFLAPAAILAVAAVNTPAFAAMLDYSRAEMPQHESPIGEPDNKVTENHAFVQEPAEPAAISSAIGKEPAAEVLEENSATKTEEPASRTQGKTSDIPDVPQKGKVVIGSPDGGSNVVVNYDKNGANIEGDVMKINLGDEVPESVYTLGNKPCSGKEIAKELESMEFAAIFMVNEEGAFKTDLKGIGKLSKKDLSFHILKLASGYNLIIVTPYKIARPIAIEGGGKMRVYAAGIWNEMQPQVTHEKAEKLEDPLVIIDGKTYDGKYSELVLQAGEIKSVTMLQPAAGEALYGKKGAKGVVIITTKEAENSGNDIEE